MRKFRIWWIYGKEEVIWGTDIEDALAKANYNSCAIQVLHFWQEEPQNN
jgi:hypothetical protein